MKRKLIICISIILILIISTLSIHYNFNIVQTCSYNDDIGIIDFCLKQEYRNVIYSDEQYNLNGDVSHGDMLIDFIENTNYDGTIYYYAAVNNDGNISTEKIIEGLNWMLEKNIKRVNISLSSKLYNNELESWIKEHDEINIYCSYNNKYNSVADYPAMYAGVIASGVDRRITYKEEDAKYTSNRMVTIKDKVKLFVGNSYLSVYSMLK